MRYKKLSLIIKPQTKTLLLIIIIGFMLTCLLSFIAINALKYEYDSKGNIIEKSFYGTDGKPIISKIDGSHIVTYNMWEIIYTENF